MEGGQKQRKNIEEAEWEGEWKEEGFPESSKVEDLQSLQPESPTGRD